MASFEGKKRSFTTYVDPETLGDGEKVGADTKKVHASDLVRLDCTFDPSRTGIKLPPSMQNCLKSTVARVAHS